MSVAQMRLGKDGSHETIFLVNFLSLPLAQPLMLDSALQLRMGNQGNVKLKNFMSCGAT